MASSSVSPLISRRRQRMRSGAAMSLPIEMSSVLQRLLEASSHQAENLQGFLDEVEWAARALDIEQIDRGHRSSYSENYYAFFASSQRWYAAEVLHASLSFEEQLVVSGVIYDISRSTCQQAAHLEQCFTELTDMLDNWGSSSMLRCKSQVKPALQLFDAAFAHFERDYIMELIAIEVQARRPVVMASNLAKELEALERHYANCVQRKQAPSDVAKVSCARARAPSMAGLLQLPEADSPCAGRLQPSSPCSRLRHFSGAESPCSLRQHHSLGEGSPCALRREFSGEVPQSTDSSQPGARAARPRKPSQNQIHRLAVSASSRSKHGNIRVVLKKLLAQVSTLNACINVRGRGREDMTVEVLEAAADAFLTKAKDVESSDSSGTLGASEAARRYLTSNILSSFTDLRNYFAEAGEDIMNIDPDLGNNAALIQRLAAWEEYWELGARFLVNSDMLEALCNVAAWAAEAKRCIPELERLLQDQDAEVFLILPRLVLLCGLVVPRQSALIESLLPHHFGQSERQDQESGTSRRQSTSKPMTDLINAFEQVSVMLGGQNEVLLQRAVLGAGQGNRAKDIDEAVDRFILQLERFSMEMQRQNPEDWNRCCSVLMQCIEAASRTATSSC
eukprot:TRINITY_DN6376_c0_g3_i1.p1 TRINITY_DN6376_c0_g3~~TRINITY_DN6376_c0_g3_i1.p1  ORF type:complete len:621 (+),score=135.39 TRINITY_DN6376_c0_g3_i1:105-1967(+)